MKGLDLAEAYYREVGLPMIRERFRAFEDHLAVGLAGPGSECFGFDDGVSRDHDWGPAFCLWLTEDDYRLVGERLQEACRALPTVFEGFGPRQASPGESGAWGSPVSAIFSGASPVSAARRKRSRSGCASPSKTWPHAPTAEFSHIYKWLHRAVRDLPVLGREIHGRVAELLASDEPRRQADLMEEKCVLLAGELRRQGLSQSSSDFLLDHAPMVHEKISDPQLRQHLSA